MIRVPLPINQPQRQHAGQPLGDDRRKPDAVHAQQRRAEAAPHDGLETPACAQRRSPPTPAPLFSAVKKQEAKDVEARQQEGDTANTRKRVAASGRIQPLDRSPRRSSPAAMARPSASAVSATPATRHQRQAAFAQHDSSARRGCPPRNVIAHDRARSPPL